MTNVVRSVDYVMRISKKYKVYGKTSAVSLIGNSLKVICHLSHTHTHIKVVSLCLTVKCLTILCYCERNFCGLPIVHVLLSL